jgi:hypothetical protein
VPGFSASPMTKTFCERYSDGHAQLGSDQIVLPQELAQAGFELSLVKPLTWTFPISGNGMRPPAATTAGLVRSSLPVDRDLQDVPGADPVAFRRGSGPRSGEEQQRDQAREDESILDPRGNALEAAASVTLHTAHLRGLWCAEQVPCRGRTRLRGRTRRSSRAPRGRRSRQEEIFLLATALDHLVQVDNDRLLPAIHVSPMTFVRLGAARSVKPLHWVAWWSDPAGRLGFLTLFRT